MEEQICHLNPATSKLCLRILNSKIAFVGLVALLILGFSKMSQAETEDNAIQSCGALDATGMAIKPCDDSGLNRTVEDEFAKDEDIFFDQKVTEKKIYQPTITTSKASLGLEIGFPSYKSRTLYINKINGTQQSIDSTGSGKDFTLSYTFRNSYLVVKFGVVNFDEEPIANASEMGFYSDYWSPVMNSVWHFEVGGDFPFEKKIESLYPSLFLNIGIYGDKFENKGLEAFADNNDYYYMRNFTQDNWTETTAVDDYKKETIIFYDIGLSANYETKLLIYKAMIKVNTMKFNKYEGVYQYYNYSGYFYSSSGFKKIYGFEHEITVQPSLYFVVSYKL